MKKGFTILELLIVIMVISILIGIALPRFRSMQDEGNIAKAKGELRTLQMAVESYYLHNNNTYPPESVTWQTALTGTTPKIISSALTDPFNGAVQYGYDLEATNSDYYVIYSLGPAGTCTAASIAADGDVTETGSTNCIFVSNGEVDTTP